MGTRTAGLRAAHLRIAGDTASGGGGGSGTIVGDLTVSGDAIIQGTVLGSAFEDTVNTDGARLPQGFQASNDCTITGADLILAGGGQLNLNGSILAGVGSGFTLPAGVLTANLRTVSTGLTLAAGNITNNLSTGVAGGQAATGGVASGENLTLHSNITQDGKIIFGASPTGMTYDEQNATLVIGAAAPNSGCVVQVNRSANSSVQFAFTNPNVGGSAYTAFLLGNAANLGTTSVGLYLFGSGSTRGVPFGVDAAVLELAGGANNLGYWIAQATGDHVFYTGTTFPNPTEVFRISNGGNVTFPSTGKFGAFGVAAAVRQTSGENLTNNVAAGGTDGTIANFTDLTLYANDAAAIRNDIYQLARKLKQVNDAMRTYGLLT